MSAMVLNANDREVIEGCQRGDREAFRVLFEEHKDRVYSIALRYSGNAASALDIAQECFLKLLASMHSFREDASFDSWLYRIVVNTCLDHQRKGRRFLPIVEDLFDLLRSGSDTILHELLLAEFKQDVQQAVAKLSADHRMVVILRYTEGLSYEQIAEIMGCSAGTVASRLNRAHKILSRRLSHLRAGNGR